MVLPEWPLGKLELCVATGWRSNVGRVRSISSFSPSTAIRRADHGRAEKRAPPVVAAKEQPRRDSKPSAEGRERASGLGHRDGGQRQAWGRSAHRLEMADQRDVGRKVDPADESRGERERKQEGDRYGPHDECSLTCGVKRSFTALG